METSEKIHSKKKTSACHVMSSRKAQQTFGLPSGRQFVRRDAFESTSTSTALASVYVGLKQRAEFTSGLRKLRVINLFS